MWVFRTCYANYFDKILGNSISKVDRLEENSLNYKPEPIDTSKVKLTEEYLKLTELLAKNTHDIWAQQRLAEGWKYGPQRDDNRKEHPGLVFYEELPESEKQYDRNTALGVIKTLLALGYRIERNEA